MRALLLSAFAAAASATAAIPQVQIDAFADNSVRVRIALPGCPITNPTFQGLLDEAPPLKTSVVRDGSRVQNGNIQASVDPNTGFVTVSRVSDGAILLNQTGLLSWPAPAGNRPGVWSSQITFAGVGGDEVIRGFGEQQDDQIIKNLPFSRVFEAAEYHAVTGGSQVLIPWYISSVGYGVLFNLPSYGNFTVDRQPSVSTWVSDATENMDFWITTLPADFDNTTASIYAPLLLQFADATGHGTPMAPYAAGFIQCKDRYRNQTQVLDVARGYFERGIPISMLIIDWFHWIELGDWALNPTCWPDPQAMVDQLKTMGIELAVTFWPFMNPTATYYQQFYNNTWLAINRTDGQPDIFWEYLQGGALVDSTSPAAAEAIFNAWYNGYGRYGIRSIWLDETEPDRSSYSYGEWQLSAGADYEIGIAWKKTWLQLFHDGFERMNVSSSERFVLARSGWTGTQRYGHHIWSGDIGSDFGSLHNQVFAGQGLGLSGHGVWTTDTGGYGWGGNATDPMFMELIVRWFQFSAFTPLMRLHGHRAGGPPDDECGATNGDNELWTLAPEGSDRYNAMLQMMMLREQLRNYVVDINAEYCTTGMPMMRPMFLQWPNDPLAQGSDVEDQFMFGAKWLVAPITSFQQYNRTVYLPLLDANHTWVYFFNQSAVGQGGARVFMDAPITEFPLFYIQNAPPVPCTPGTWLPVFDGFLAAGGDVLPAGAYTLAAAQQLCTQTAGCQGITFQADSPSPTGTIPNVYFKNNSDASSATGWYTYTLCLNTTSAEAASA
jgi:alpha-D-xyloside xylohydrolase